MNETCKCPDCSDTDIFKDGWCKECWDNDCRDIFGDN